MFTVIAFFAFHLYLWSGPETKHRVLLCRNFAMVESRRVSVRDCYYIT